MAGYLIELHYLPVSRLLAPLAAGMDIRIEQHDHFQKKSGRNRCHLLSSYGAIQLSIPLQKGKHQQQPYRDVRIANDLPWQRTHWRTIRSCYGRAPFYEHYADSLAPLFEKRETFLWDWNMLLWLWLLDQLHLSGAYTLSEDWTGETDQQTIDLRGRTLITIQDPFRDVPYTQVFSDRHGFTKGLSVLDLLFCAGPQARMILKAMNRE